MKSKKIKRYAIGLCMGFCTLNAAQAESPTPSASIASSLRLESHVQSLNELTERRRISTLYTNDQSIFRGAQHNHVNVGSGNGTFVRRDLVAKSRLPIIVARVYDSSLDDTGDFGQGWQLSLSEAITINQNGSLSYTDDSASNIQLISTQTGYAVAPNEITDIKQVVVLSEQSLRIDHTTGWQKTFVLMGDSYRLTKINDAYTNSIQLTYQQQKISKLTGQNGHFVDITRDEQGRIVAVTDDHNRQVSYQYSKKGLLSAVTDLGSNLWQYDYQGNGLLKKITDPEGNTAAAFSYGKNQRVTSAQIRSAKHRYSYSKQRTTVTDENNHDTVYLQKENGVTYEVTNTQGTVSTVELDKNNRVTKLGHDGLLSAEFTYDEKGRASELKRRKQDGSYEQLTYQYDTQNRLIGVTNNNTLAAQSAFNTQNSPIRIVADGIERTYGYAANGDVISQTEGDVKRTFQYDTNGLLTAFTEDGERATFTYSKLGRLTSVTFPDGSTHNYQYDALGFRTKTQRSDNSAIDYSYDTTGNLRGMRETKINGDTTQKDIVLDENHLTKGVIVDGNQALDVIYSVSGNPTRVVYNNKTVSYGYDDQNRLIKIDEGEGDEQILTHQYNDNEVDLRIQLDDRTAAINNPNRKAPNGVNSLYTRSYGTQWQYVMFNAQLGRFMLVDEKGYIPADTNFKSSFQRRRLYNAIATTKRNQRSFDKPSSSAYLPAEYQTINCGPLYCILYGVILDTIGTVHLGDSKWISALGVYDNDCVPEYTFAIDNVVQATGFLNGFSHTFNQVGTHSIRVNAACTCGQYYQWDAVNYTVLPVINSVGISTPSNTVWTIDQQRNMPDVEFTATASPSNVPLQDITFHWYLTLAFTENGKNFSHRIPASGTIDIQGSNSWSPAWGNLLAGGNNMTVHVSASYAGHTTTGSPVSGYQIHGENPSDSQIFGLATTAEQKAICWKESSHRQFTGTAYTGSGLPVYGAPDGWGLMQKDPLQGEYQLWDWQRALTDGISHLATNHTESENYLEHWYDEAARTTDPNDDWAWNPHTQHPERIWNDAFARYNTGDPIYSPNGNQGNRNCQSNSIGCTYSDTVRGHINNPPW